MIITAIIVAFLLDQIRPAGSGHVIAVTLRRWADAVARYIDAGRRLHAWLAWTLAVALPALAAGLIGWLCTRTVGWLGQLAWAVAVLYGTLGFRQFSHHGTAIRDALAAGDGAKARALLAQWQDEQSGDYSGGLSEGLATPGLAWDSVARRAIAHAVLCAHRWVFGVLFWFCLLAPLGLAPAGAVLYRCAELAARHWRDQTEKGESVASPALLAVAQAAWRVIDWLPARVTALAFAIVGNFEEAIAAWRQHRADGAGGSADKGSDAVLLAAAAGALGIRLDDNATALDARFEQPAAPVAAAMPQANTAAPAYPPDWEPAASPDAASLAGAADAPGLSGAEPNVRHFAQVAGLLWRGVALWLLLLALLTLAHVLG